MRTRNVLIAEDDASLRAALERYLGSKGHATVAVPDCTTALAHLRRHEFDVALVEINMPGLDGLEVLRQMRDQPDPPEVVIMTGDGTVETAITAVKLGAYDYVTKPYRMGEIEVVVEKAGEKRDLALENARLQSALKNVVERVAMLSRDEAGIHDELPLPGIAARSIPSSNVPLAELERQHIQAVLAETNWHQGNAAAKLGISSKTLYRKIREYGFVRPREQQGG